MKKLKKDKKPIEVFNSITNSTFIGVKWDEPSLEVMKIVASGLLNLTELFKSQNVTIESLLKINQPKDM